MTLQQKPGQRRQESRWQSGQAGPAWCASGDGALQKRLAVWTESAPSLGNELSGRFETETKRCGFALQG
jgi:hypothetical protein